MMFFYYVTSTRSAAKESEVKNHAKGSGELQTGNQRQGQNQALLGRHPHVNHTQEINGLEMEQQVQQQCFTAGMCFYVVSP